MSRVILARHGNTFRPEETPVWVGARTDMPLVEKGIAQAHALGSALRRAHIIPDMIVSGPLQRTHETARIVAEILDMNTASIRIDPRLTEIDYGVWEGLSAAEIENAGDGAELAAWNESATFPASPGWSPSEAELRINAQAVLSEIKNGTALIVTSNGILRFFARAAVNSGAFPDHKAATGHMSIMERAADGWHINQWNVSPTLFVIPT